MSLSKQDLIDQLQAYRSQRNQAAVALQNLDGAIATVEFQIKMVVEREAEAIKAEADAKALAESEQNLAEAMAKLDHASDMTSDMELKQGDCDNGGTDHE